MPINAYKSFGSIKKRKSTTQSVFSLRAFNPQTPRTAAHANGAEVLRENLHRQIVLLHEICSRSRRQRFPFATMEKNGHGIREKRQYTDK